MRPGPAPTCLSSPSGCFCCSGRPCSTGDPGETAVVVCREDHRGDDRRLRRGVGVGSLPHEGALALLHRRRRRSHEPGVYHAGEPGPVAHVHVVQHGIDVNGNGEYDIEGAGVSTFAENLGVPDVPEEATDPASCGVVTGAMAPTAPVGGLETGGADAARPGADVPVLALGVLLLLGSIVLYRRSRRARG